LGWGTTSAQNAPATNTRSVNSAPVNSANTDSANANSAQAPSDEVQAREWGLKPQEWARYKQLMQGRLGVFSPGIDPLTALGIEARSDAERARYAELQVAAERARVERELAYQLAYDAAWKRLYPNQKRINSPSGAIAPRSSGSNSGSGRLAVFVKANCPPCDQRVQQLQAAGGAFDIYMVGDRNDDAVIRAWAIQAKVDPARVRAKTITLNHDGGKWLTLGMSGALPAVVREVNGKWQRQ
jgi:integrating conjugative element protein (TIGR03759 family)